MRSPGVGQKIDPPRLSDNQNCDHSLDIDALDRQPFVISVSDCLLTVIRVEEKKMCHAKKV